MSIHLAQSGRFSSGFASSSLPPRLCWSPKIGWFDTVCEVVQCESARLPYAVLRHESPKQFVPTAFLPTFHEFAVRCVNRFFVVFHRVSGRSERYEIWHTCSSAKFIQTTKHAPLTRYTYRRNVCFRFKKRVDVPRVKRLDILPSVSRSKSEFTSDFFFLVSRCSLFRTVWKYTKINFRKRTGHV